TGRIPGNLRRCTVDQIKGLAIIEAEFDAFALQRTANRRSDRETRCVAKTGGRTIHPFISSSPIRMPTAAPVKEKEKDTATGQKPVTVIRARGVSASIFQNHGNSDGRDMTFHKVSIQRAYKEGDERKHTT